MLHASSSHQLQLDIEKGGWDQETAHADTIYLEIILGMPEDNAGMKHLMCTSTDKVNCQIRTGWLYWNGGEGGGVQSGRRLEVGV